MSDFRLVKVELVEAGRDCENCGNYIKWFYHLEGKQNRKIVGSECAGHLLNDPNLARDILARRARRAARQWKDQKPPSRKGETKEQYISRRVYEMSNAWKAHQAYKQLPKLKDYARKINLFSRRFIHEYERYNIWSPFGAKVLKEKQLSRIEKRYKANRFDFVRATWEVKKV